MCIFANRKNLSGKKNDHPALVLGMFETGLGVVRSLGQEGITVFGLDHKRDIGFYSRYVKASICPHPLEQVEDFILFLISFSKRLQNKPVLFITSDDFLLTISKNRERLKEYYLFNMASEKLLSQIVNKYEQYKLVQQTGIPLPLTFIINESKQLNEFKNILPYPVIIKALNVNEWRKKVSDSVKGFVAGNPAEFLARCTPLLTNGIDIVVQEIIVGPDTNHYKYCACYSLKGTPLCEFTLRKIRQNPIYFGVGAVVESIKYKELLEVGRKLFLSIGYQGVGSAEFKMDEKDGKLKLIEINPRYWQQNYLTTVCGMNFPILDYLEMTGQNPESISAFRENVKWVNRYMDFDSFLKYHKEGKISYRQWRNSLKGEKVYSDFAWDDLIPVFYTIGFGRKLYKIPYFLWKKLFR